MKNAQKIRENVAVDKKVPTYYINGPLGMMRHVYIILDMSETMKLQDMKPSRLLCVLNLLEKFAEEFFHLNPISQIGIITTKNKRAEIVSDLAGNPKAHVEQIRSDFSTKSTDSNCEF